MAEGAPLLRAYRVKPIEGSNPSLSAIKQPTKVGFFMADIEGERTLAVRSIADAIETALRAARRVKKLSKIISESIPPSLCST